MGLTSVWFYIFLAAVCALYYGAPARFRRYALLAANAAFYLALGLKFTAVILSVLAAAYLFGLLVARASNKKLALGLSAAALLGVLFFFKYIGFAFSLAGIENDFFAALAPPVGISFYTLTCVGYLADVYRGDVEAERDPVSFLLFAGFYLQIMSGPIPRAKTMLPQYLEPKEFDFDRLRRGFLRILFGLFVKLVVADNLASSTGYYFGNILSAGAPRMITAVVFYGFQIYCDFRAYTDIALGGAELLGITLLENFKAPYLSKSIREFWRRWHISLSSWFRDYLYIPLGGSRKGLFVTCLNTLVIFAASGLWHGASLNFLVWGLLHGSYLVLSILTRAPRERLRARLGIKEDGVLRRILCPVFVFLLVDFAWIFFRAASLVDVREILYQFTLFPVEIVPSYLLSSVHLPNRFAVYAGLAVVFAADLFTYRGEDIRERYFRLPAAVRWIGYYLLALAIMFFGNVGAGTQFIYYAF